MSDAAPVAPAASVQTGWTPYDSPGTGGHVWPLSPETFASVARQPCGGSHPGAHALPPNENRTATSLLAQPSSASGLVYAVLMTAPAANSSTQNSRWAAAISVAGVPKISIHRPCLVATAVPDAQRCTPSTSSCRTAAVLVSYLLFSSSRTSSGVSRCGAAPSLPRSCYRSGSPN